MVLPLIHSGVLAFSNQDITIKLFLFLKKKLKKIKTRTNLMENLDGTGKL